MAEITVRGTRGVVKLMAAIDTGFNGFLNLPIKDAVRIGLEFITTEPAELADGSIKEQLVFAATVRFLNLERVVAVYLTESETPLIGTALLADCELNIDFPAGKVNISRRPIATKAAPGKKSPSKKKRPRA